MKALTIQQPYASLIASGEKWIENRTWYTNYRGPLAIHAGKGTKYLDRDEITNYPTGCVIAIAKLVACVHIEQILRNDASSLVRKKLIPGSNRSWSEVARHKHAEGPWCWILEDLQAFSTDDFVYLSGRQGFWEYNDKQRTGSHVR